MSMTIKSLVNGVFVTNSIATYYTVPTLTKTRLTEINLTNSHTSAVTVDVYAVPSGGSYGNANRMFAGSSPYGLVLSPGETKQIGMNTYLEEGATLQMVASVTNVVGCRASGIEVVG